MLSQVDNDLSMDEPPPLDDVKENGYKPNQRKRAEKKNNTKGVETRSSKKDQQTKMNLLASTLDKSRKRA